MSPTTALMTLDCKVADLQKKLNKLRFRSQRKAEYLVLLTTEARKMEKENMKAGEFTKEEQRQRFLENEIHKTTLKMMEADMVRKKYDVILDMLRQERLSYMTQIEELEKNNVSQVKEVSSLEGEYKEACDYRDEARAESKDWEVEYQVETKERERTLIEVKRAMKDKKDMFKTVDHLLMGSEASSNRDAASSASGSIIKDGDTKEVWDAHFFTYILIFISFIRLASKIGNKRERTFLRLKKHFPE